MKRSHKLSLTILVGIFVSFACSGVVYGQSPAITAISPASGPVGTLVTITGTGFGTTQGSSTVKLNSTSATVASWSATSITSLVPSGASSGTFTVTVGGQGATSPTYTVTALPSSWSDEDIGSVGTSGSATYANGVFTVEGAGAEIYGTADAFHFAYQSLSGDGSIVARLVSVQGGSSYATAGVMIRETLTAGSTNAKISDWPSYHDIYFDLRSSTGGSTSEPGSVRASPPYWVKVVRSGSTFSGYTSLDGVNWTQLASNQTISMAQNVYIGLAVGSGSTSSLTTATFDNVSVNSASTSAPVISSVSATTGSAGTQLSISGSGFGSAEGSSEVFLNSAFVPVNSWTATSIAVTLPSGVTTGPFVVAIAPSMNASNPVQFTVTSSPLPSGWVDQDMGAFATLGTATFASGTFTVNGSGSSFASTPDELHFVYQPLSGDGTIVARVASASNSYAQTEVMMRETLAQNAKSMAVADYAGSVYSVYRTTTGGSASYTNAGVTGTLPYWVKLVRSGGSFSGYTSSDGENWVQVGATQSISMAQSVYVGLGLSSGSTTTVYTVTFDNVSLSTSSNPAPVIANVSATTGSVGSQVTITGTGFGSSQGNSVVLLNDTPVTVNSWSATSITTTIPSGATSGYLVVSVAPGMDDSNPERFTITSNPLPSGWLDQDVGEVAVVGSATFANGTFTVQSAGSTFSSTPDAFHFVYQPLSGDGAIIARVASVSSNYAQAEVVIRETLDQDAKSLAVMDYAGRVYSVSRTVAAGSASNINSGVSATVPYWIKLVRNGNDFTGYTSADGNNWTIFAGSQPVSMQQNVYVGLGLSSGNTTLYTATFDNVSVSTSSTSAPTITSLSATTGSVGTQVTITGTGFGSTQGNSEALLNDAALTVNSWSSTSISTTVPSGATSGYLVVDAAPSMDSSNPVFFAVTSQPLPNGWFDQDVGQVGTAGSATYASGVFTVKGAGTLVTGTADSFHFVYQPLTANGTIVARVASGSSYGEQVTVMMRETLAPSSTEVSAGLFSYSSPYYGYLYYRTLTGASTAQSSSVSVTYPYWLKVVRSANSFTGYVSADDVTWVQVGSAQTFTTAQTVNVGFGVSSGNPSTLDTATFDNVSVTLGSSLPNPTITGISPSSGAPETSATISGSGFGSSQGGSSVNFNGTTATSITSWSDSQIVLNVPDGATSGPVAVTVGNITGQGPTYTVVFNVTLTDSLGNQTTYSSSLFGGAWALTNAQGSGCSSCTTRGNIQSQYDGNGNPAWTTDAVGNTTSFQFNSSNEMVTQTAQASANSVATTTYTYNSFGEALTAQDALGNTTTNTYDSHGNLTSVTTPAPNNTTTASKTQFAYNSLGELTTITDPLNNVTTLAYTSVGLINTITDAQSNVTTYGYDSHGNRTSVTDALNHQTTFTYDSMDRLTKITYPDSTTTQFGYDYRGRRTSVTDQNSKVTSYAYDDADRLITVTDAASNVTTYGYDTENNLTSIEDANSHTTSFTYDAFGRVTKTTFPSGYVETYGYDADNNLTSKTDRNNQYITYSYDQLNRLTQKTYPDSTAVNYTYDLDSRLTHVTDPTGTYAFTFDNMGRLTGTTTNYSFLTTRSFTTSYSYDKASNRTGFTDPENGSTSYAFDTLNRLQTLTPPSAFTSGNFGFSYDALSRRTQMTRPNSVSTLYAYDNLSRLTSVLHQLSGSTIDGAAYTLDNAGNRTAKTDERAAVTSNYSYDAIYELTQVTQGVNTTESYTFDPVGNRLSSLGVSSYTNNSSNELTSTSNASYTYDYNGNALTKVVGSNTTSYAWDFENRMSSVTLPGSGGTVSFAYDPFGRRIKKVTPTATSVFAYDGDNLTEETNSSGAVVARYEQGLNIDQPLAMLRSSTASFYHADGLGSVTSLSNSAGSLTQTYGYDSFGKQTSSSGSLTNPFQYTAREFDSETALYYYRSRYYDPTPGRFLSEDRIGFASDAYNFYAYILNDPTDWVDPMGTSLQCPSFLPWCPPPLPPPPPSPQPPGPPQLFKYNNPPPRTGPLAGDALGLANCISYRLGSGFVVTGGSECTPDGRHVPGGVPNSKHCTNQAFDMWPAGMDRKKVFCAAKKCGAQFINDEGNHWHFETVPHKNGNVGSLPTDCECQ